MKSKQTENIKVTSLIADDKNFNKGSENGAEMIRKSFQKFGAGRSILLDKNNRIIAGNKSVEYSGIEDVLIVESDGTQLIAVKRTDIDLDSPQGREMALADNASAKANIVFDAELVEAELGEAVCEEWGIDVATKLEAVEDDFDVDSVTETDIVLGDLFEIGEHRLLCGDSTQTDTFEKLMQGEMADMCVTDPPYNVAYEGGTKEKLTIENDSMSNDDFYKFLYDFYSALTTAVKKGGAIYVWHASSEIINFGKAMVDAGWLLKQQLIWVKNSMVMGRQDYQWKHEPCLYGWLDGAAHKWHSDRKQTTVIEWDKPQRNGEHPTMKPIGLFAYQIGNSSKKGDIVIDAFGGSGTTMVACHEIGRKARLVEYDPKYCQVIIDRMRKLDPSLTIKRNGLNIS
jgi:DNA modification methylase